MDYIKGHLNYVQYPATLNRNAFDTYLLFLMEINIFISFGKNDWVWMTGLYDKWELNFIRNGFLEYLYSFTLLWAKYESHSINISIYNFRHSNGYLTVVLMCICTMTNNQHFYVLISHLHHLLYNVHLNLWVKFNWVVCILTTEIWGFILIYSVYQCFVNMWIAKFFCTW